MLTKTLTRRQEATKAQGFCSSYANTELPGLYLTCVSTAGPPVHSLLVALQRNDSAPAQNTKFSLGTDEVLCSS